MSQIGQTVIALERFFVISCFCQYIDKGNKEGKLAKSALEYVIIILLNFYA